jgi:hypothetical protein
MPQHAAAARSTAWFHPSVRDARYRPPRTVPAVAPPVRATPATARRSDVQLSLSWLERVERWFWRQEQKRVEDYLARSVDVADLEMRLRCLERRNPSGF